MGSGVYAGGGEGDWRRGGIGGGGAFCREDPVDALSVDELIRLGGGGGRLVVLDSPVRSARNGS